ncbi:17928_t:CDS:2 [Funneliformis geosporum]|uniref:17928_t:CDS:1 n=1 Tax=Funneliformis geosporum TaxID=1117311 RepID=A0A9W4SN13_9GLOM|nr:17928_t:CDS:2 [Funneliformis geosporum]
METQSKALNARTPFFIDLYFWSKVDSRRKRKDAISTAPKTVIATRERERASCARGGGRGHGKRKTVTEAISFVPNTFQNDFDKTTDNLDHKRNRVYTTLSSLKNDHVASDFSDDLNSNFDDFGRNASVIITSKNLVNYYKFSFFETKVKTNLFYYKKN